MSDLTDRLRSTGYCENCFAPDHANEAADVLDAIDALHQPVIDSEWLVKRCEQCDMEWPCRTHLLLHPTTLDEAIDTLGTVHK